MWSSLIRQRRGSVSSNVNVAIRLTLRFRSTEGANTNESTSRVRVWEVPADGVTAKRGKKKRSLYESYSSSTSWTRVADDDANEQEKKATVRESLERYGEAAVRHFLPHGYPETVEPGYARYASFQFASSVAGSAAMVLSTQSLLHAVVGLSSQSSLALSAGVNWVIKDGIGQLGGVLFASYLGQRRGLDVDPKRWRILSAWAMDASTVLELCTPLCPQYFLPMASIANVGKNMGFLSASASRAALHQSLMGSIGCHGTDHVNNLADITAKAGSQSIAAGLVGTALGVASSPLLGDNLTHVAMAFGVLSVVHQVCTFLSVKAVSLRSFNRHRLHLVLHHFVAVAHTCGKHEVLSPAQVAEVESFLPLVTPDQSHEFLTVGCSLKELCVDGGHAWHQLQLDGERYLLSCTRKPGDAKKDVQVNLTFLEGAKGTDVIRGMLHAYFARYCENACPSKQGPDDAFFGKERHVDMQLVQISHEQMVATFERLIQGMHDVGWRTETQFVSVEDNHAFRLHVQEEGNSQ